MYEVNFILNFPKSPNTKNLSFNRIGMTIPGRQEFTLIKLSRCSISRVSYKIALDNHRRREFEDRLARIEGVRDVHNDLRLQGRSSLDERLRLRLYARIYNDPRFAQYASWPEPPVRIFVDHGRVTLAGTVRSKVEQAALGYMARESLAFSVKNVVQVEGSVPKEDQPRNEG